MYDGERGEGFEFWDLGGKGFLGSEVLSGRRVLEGLKEGFGDAGVGERAGDVVVSVCEGHEHVYEERLVGVVSENLVDAGRDGLDEKLCRGDVANRGGAQGEDDADEEVEDRGDGAVLGEGDGGPSCGGARVAELADDGVCRL